ncbi:MAG TPA: hypothetical protein DDZ88_23260 [Verrucomicrobiales bacterium]|nr:hypothetical protein [Verrucomicrobiales bacterium]
MSASFKTILTAVDFSTGSRAALDQAARLAMLHSARLHVLHVIDRDALAALADSRKEPFESAAAHAMDGGRKALDHWLAQSKLPAAFEVTLVVGAPLHELLEHAKSLRADLLVAGITGSGENPAGAGSVSGKLARKSPVDVLLVRADHPRAFKKIVACVDFSEHSPRVAGVAREIALQDSAAVDFLHVWRDPGSMLAVIGPFGESGLGMANLSVPPREELVTAIQAQLHDFVKESAAGINAREVLHEDRRVGHGIADHAQKDGADLIVLGALGRTNLRYLLLGSTAERLLMRLPCSVLVVKPPQD